MRLIRIWICTCVVATYSLAPAAETISEPFLGIRHIQRIETSPRPLFINIVEINPNAPGIAFRLSPPDPNPPSPGGVPDETITQTVRQYLAEQDAQVAINASFFRLENGGLPLWTNNVGIAVSDGNKYSPWDSTGQRGINIDQNNVATMIVAPAVRPTGFETTPPVSLFNAVAGSDQVLTDGVVTAPARSPTPGDFTHLQPRTAVGIAADGKILLATLDGRQNGFSEGFYLDEVATYLQQYGAINVLNLDGGGSTTMAFDHFNDVNTNGTPVNELLINSPVGRGTVSTERYNGANLAVFAQINPSFVPKPPAPPIPPGVIVIEDFEAGEGRFTSAPTLSGSNVGVAATSTADRILNDSFQGEGSERIAVVSSNPATPGLKLRFLSGGGAPGSNLPLQSSGYVGYILKLLGNVPIGTTVQAALLIDDGTGLERSAFIDIPIDNDWHLFQWNFNDANSWENFSAGNGQIDADTVTIDALYLSTNQNLSFTVYFDLVAHNPSGTLDALIPEPASALLLGFLSLPLARPSRRHARASRPVVD